MSESDYMLCYR